MIGLGSTGGSGVRGARPKAVWLAGALISCGEATDALPPGRRPSIDVFEITPAETVPSGAVALHWRVTDAINVEIHPGIGVVVGTSVVVRPAASTVYSLEAENAAGFVIEERSLTVTQPSSPPAAPEIHVHSQSNGRVLVRWAPVVLASGYVVEGRGMHETDFHSVLHGDATQLYASVSADANALFTFRVAATNEAGQSDFAEGTVLSPPGPPEGPSLVVVPNQVSLPRGGTQCFTVDPPRAVQWVLGSGPFGGEIDASGCFRAPSSAGATVIIAISEIAATAVASYP